MMAARSRNTQTIRSSWENRRTSGISVDREMLLTPPKFYGDSENVVPSNNTSGSDSVKSRLADKSNDYLRKWSKIAPSASNKYPSSNLSIDPPPQKHFTPNKDSPTWKSLQLQSLNGGSEAEEALVTLNKTVSTESSSTQDSMAKTASIESSDDGTVGQSSLQQHLSTNATSEGYISSINRNERLEESVLGSRRERASSAPIVENGERKSCNSKCDGDNSAPSSSDLSSRIVGGQNNDNGAYQKTKQKPRLSSFVEDTKPKISTCASTDSTSSSLIYSLGDTLSHMSHHSSISALTNTKLEATLRMAGEMLGDDKNGASNATAAKTEAAPERPNSAGVDASNNQDLIALSSSSSEEVDHDVAAADLIATTLAECRLLLDMSPPPTPLSTNNHPSKEFETFANEMDGAHSSGKEKNSEEANDDVVGSDPNHRIEVADDAVESDPDHRIKVAIEEGNNNVSKHDQTAIVTTPSTAIVSTPPTAIVSTPSRDSTFDYPTSTSDLSKFLQCPVCHNDFTDGSTTAGDTEKVDRRPLHSFSCEHIVCQECVTSKSSDTTLVACPECGVVDAFDKCRPVVSRGYINLVKRMLTMQSQSEAASRRGDGRSVLSSGVSFDGRSAGLPRQICVPSPRANSNSVTEKDGENMSLTSASVVCRTSHCQAGLAVETSTESKEVVGSSEPVKFEDNQPMPPNEPHTPVSRAELRFLQRKEKLALSLEKVNRILDKSKKAKQHTAGTSSTPTIEEETFDAQDELVKASSVEDNTGIGKRNGGREFEVFDVTSNYPDTFNDRRDIASEGGYEEGPVAPRQEFTGRHKPELRVDTSRAPVASSKRRPSPLLVQEQDHNPRSISQIYIPAPSNTKAAVDPFAGPSFDTKDIFRGGNAPSLIEFGPMIGQSASNDSSLTGMDSAFLLTNRSQPMSSRSSNRYKDILKNSGSKIIKDRFTSDTHVQALTNHCPQFLPALTYSTMHEEHDEFTGLVRDATSPKWGFDANENAAKPRKSKYQPVLTAAGTPVKFINKLSQSFDDIFRPNFGFGGNDQSWRYDCASEYNRREPAEDVAGATNPFPELDDANGPTYDFCSHSCSLSGSFKQPNEDIDTRESGSSLGGLVTHKPKKFHKKLLKKLRLKRRR